MINKSGQPLWYSDIYGTRNATSLHPREAKVKLPTQTASHDQSTEPNSGSVRQKLSKLRLSIILANRLPSGERRRIIRNVIFISIAFTVLYSAFRSMENLQTSINPEHGLGTQSLAVIHIVSTFSSLVLPSFIIVRLTVKWTMAICMLCFSVYIAAQFHPRFYTLIPAGIVLGLGYSPMWIAQATYLTQVAHVYSAIVNEKPEIVTVRFFGIFFLFFESSQVWGNIISSIVLSHRKYKTLAPDDPILQRCGPSFCPNDDVKERPEAYHRTLFSMPSSEDLYTLASIYFVCSLCSSVIIAVNVDSLVRYGEKERAETLQTEKLFTTTILLMKNCYCILLIPLSTWYGMEYSFFTADYTQAYVTCAYSIHYVGYVMMTFGVLGSIFSMSLGSITDITGRLPIFTFGAILNLSLIFTLMYWQPTSAQAVVFYIISASWGMADAVWQTQIYSLIGMLFPNQEEVAFSNFKLFESIGRTLAYFYSPYLCTIPELYIMTTTLVVGMIGYYTVEVMEYRTSHSTKIASDVNQQEIQDQETEEEERSSIATKQEAGRKDYKVKSQSSIKTSPA